MQEGCGQLTRKGSALIRRKPEFAAYTAGIQLCFHARIVVELIPPCDSMSATWISPRGVKTAEAALKNS